MSVTRIDNKDRYIKSNGECEIDLIRWRETGVVQPGRLITMENEKKIDEDN